MCQEHLVRDRLLPDCEAARRILHHTVLLDSFIDDASEQVGLPHPSRSRLERGRWRCCNSSSEHGAHGASGPVAPSTIR